MIETNLSKTSSFFNSADSYEKSDLILLGVPMDYTASNIPGSRFAPKRVRELSYTLENYSPFFDDFIDEKFYDAGDIVLPWGNTDKSIKFIGETAKGILSDGKKIVSIGGDHLITYPVVKEYAEKYKDLVVLQFDAHTDLREEWNNEKYSHATVLKLIHDIIKKGNLYQFGIRSGSKEEFDFAKKHCHIYKNDVYEPLKKVLGNLSNKDVYITIDIDVLDPAFAPGTGYIEAGGISSKELLDSVSLLLSESNVNIVGADVVEVCPPTDNSDRTSAIAAKLLREIIIGMAKNKK
ncbi:MAG: agmatinase [Deltaproteobacteria bacterium]|jgi:agmatinase|uniref:Agmatinase n=1 Tax=Candidatus Acidulodesulfobacterium acidiphilum TaxID=2597224 RepID=A0A520XBF6_9DELT|nr:agmatinase [Deltaproteobacteria bacterium]MDA8298982.1 agmatinase [Deltaproteobacteria bacterium]RZV38455.1 MAG: agmatinase [Candidatus Acidulodesulfobacterium acidiphilum]